MNNELVDFGWKATSEVLTKQEAINLGIKYHLVLRELGGTGGGIIGALAAAALRAEGNHGRFVELRGIRDIDGIISAGDLKAHTAIEAVQTAEGILLDDSQRIESYGWIRPSLQGGRIVLRVQPVASSDGAPLWEPVENRKDKPRKKQEACP
jgi:hypothetical protein